MLARSRRAGAAGDAGGGDAGGGEVGDGGGEVGDGGGEKLGETIAQFDLSLPASILR